jgi:Bifunctional DNA primase/polymerase, N-terminal
MTGETLRRALAFAAQGWPVFPCLPGQKIPATPHGYLDATTDQRQITRWFTRHPDWNLAIATGAPGPDVLDVDEHGEAGNGYGAFNRLVRAGLTAGASAYVATPSGGLHAYFTGTGQRNRHLPGHHLDFRSAGGYVVAPPSKIGGRPYELVKKLDGHGSLDWAKVTQLLEPRKEQRPEPRPVSNGGDLDRLADWVARQAEGNRNEGLFWAANRALDADRAADLSPLAAAARQAGLEDREISRTLDSARKTSQISQALPAERTAEVSGRTVGQISQAAGPARTVGQLNPTPDPAQGTGQVSRAVSPAHDAGQIGRTPGPAHHPGQVRPFEPDREAEAVS